MKIERIRLKNFKMFQDVTLEDIPPFCVVIGANGTGKSSFFQVFGFLKDCLTYNATAAIQSRGGFVEMVSRGHEQENICIEIQFRMEISRAPRLVTYSLEITNQNKKIEIAREILSYHNEASGSSFNFIDFAFGKGKAIVNEEDFNKTDEQLAKEFQALDRSDILAIKGLGQFQKFKAANAVRQWIENWHISDFQINLARGSKDAAGYADHLSVTGDNLQVVANRIRSERPELFVKITSLMKQIVPGISSIEPEATSDGRLLLKFQDGSFKDPFVDKFVSDGTIKMFAYLLLLYDPNPHQLLCVEVPENQLYHQLLWELAEEFRAYAQRGGQVFVSTHSPDFLNAARLEEVLWLFKKNGYTSIRRARDDDQLAALMAEGDQMGYLWKQGYFPEIAPQ